MFVSSYKRYIIGLKLSLLYTEYHHVDCASNEGIPRAASKLGPFLISRSMSVQPSSIETFAYGIVS